MEGHIVLCRAVLCCDVLSCVVLCWIFAPVVIMKFLTTDSAATLSHRVPFGYGFSFEGIVHVADAVTAPSFRVR